MTLSAKCILCKLTAQDLYEILNDCGHNMLTDMEGDKDLLADYMVGVLKGFIG